MNTSQKLVLIVGVFLLSWVVAEAGKTIAVFNQLNTTMEQIGR